MKIYVWSAISSALPPPRPLTPSHVVPTVINSIVPEKQRKGQIKLSRSSYPVKFITLFSGSELRRVDPPFLAGIHPGSRARSRPIDVLIQQVQERRGCRPFRSSTRISGNRAPYRRQRPGKTDKIRGDVREIPSVPSRYASRDSWRWCQLGKMHCKDIRRLRCGKKRGTEKMELPPIWGKRGTTAFSFGIYSCSMEMNDK